MSIFCYKKMEPRSRLGAEFRIIRELSGQTLLDVSGTTRIPQKYLALLETESYNKLPAAKAYRIAYVKEYATALGLDPKAALKQFCREGGMAGADTKHPRTHTRVFPFASLSILARNLTLGFTALLFLGYLGWQVRGILEPPKLLVYAPFEGGVSNDQSITVQGLTNPETHLTINGQEVMVNENGNFETKIDANVGLNTITVSAAKKHGKTTTLTRHVVVRPKLLGGAVSVK